MFWSLSKLDPPLNENDIIFDVTGIVSKEPFRRRTGSNLAQYFNLSLESQITEYMGLLSVII